MEIIGRLGIKAYKIILTFIKNYTLLSFSTKTVNNKKVFCIIVLLFAIVINNWSM